MEGVAAGRLPFEALDPIGANASSVPAIQTTEREPYFELWAVRQLHAGRRDGWSDFT